MKPLVGITSDYTADKANYFLAEDYVSAVALCGGIPLILPAIEEDESKTLIARLDALVISGGDFDLDPRLYGESPQPQLGNLNPLRTDYELQLLKAALIRDLPVLGICGGLQLLNVAFEGSLYQHLPAQYDSQIAHEQKGKQKAAAHAISIEPESILHDILNTTDIMVNSTHHQAIKKLGPGLKTVAYAPDGIIEAAESTTHRFILGVQWHPESLIARQPVWKGMFYRLIQEAGQKSLPKPPASAIL